MYAKAKSVKLQYVSTGIVVSKTIIKTETNAIILIDLSPKVISTNVKYIQQRLLHNFLV